MPRTSQTLVGSICDIEEDADLTGFILSANELVTEVCASATKADGTPFYTDVRLELIERWLAAHLYTNRDPRVTDEKAGSVGAGYQSKVDLGFNTSHYGQTAMRLDTNGGLAKLNDDMLKGKPRVTASWLGLPVEEQGE